MSQTSWYCRLEQVEQLSLPGQLHSMSVLTVSMAEMHVDGDDEALSLSLCLGQMLSELKPLHGNVPAIPCLSPVLASFLANPPACQEPPAVFG